MTPAAAHRAQFNNLAYRQANLAAALNVSQLCLPSMLA